MLDTFCGVNVNYRISRQNDTNKFVLFLHGWGGSLSSFAFCENFCNKSKLNTLNLDLPNFGKSDKITKHFTVYDYAKVVNQILQKNSINNVSIICHSFGCRIALILAAFLPQKVDQLLIVDGAGLKYKKTISEKFKFCCYKTIKFLNRIKITQINTAKFGSSDYKDLTQVMKNNFINIINSDLQFTLQMIQCPTLLVWGKNDKDTPMYMANEMKKKIANCGLVVFKNAGHFSYLDEPNKFLKIIQSFIK